MFFVIAFEENGEFFTYRRKNLNRFFKLIPKMESFVKNNVYGFKFKINSQTHYVFNMKRFPSYHLLKPLIDSVRNKETLKRTIRKIVQFLSLRGHSTYPKQKYKVRFQNDILEAFNAFGEMEFGEFLRSLVWNAKFGYITGLSFNRGFLEVSIYKEQSGNLTSQRLYY